MLGSEINIRDPFILRENGKFYLYGTRAAGFGMGTSGFDVYISDNLTDWSEPLQCFDSARYGLNKGANWAPEVHKYKGAYYMFASFMKDEGLRGTFILRSEKPEGPFVPHSDGAVSPKGWECIDGTFYVENGTPYLIFVHEHTQIIDGRMCFIELSDDLTHSIGEPTDIFRASDPEWADKKAEGDHYITDGPFMYKAKNGSLLMLWSTGLRGKYAECIVRFNNGSIKDKPEHLDPIIDDDGGHGMLFESGGQLYFTYHSPNSTGNERVCLVRVRDTGDSIEIE